MVTAGTSGATSAASIGLKYLNNSVSGIDTDSMVQALAAARQVPITQLQDQKAAQQTLLTAYQSLNANLVSLGVFALDLQMPTTYQTRKIANSDPSLVTASASSGAAVGSHHLVISKLAQAHQISSGEQSSASHALGYAGSVLINGQSLTVQASDNLQDLADNINGTGAGVTASVMTVGAGKYRLVLNANQTGVEHAIDLVEANSRGILQGLGLVSSAATVKHALPSGLASDALSSAGTAVGTALGIGDAPSGQLTLTDDTGSYTVASVNLATDSLQAVADRINAAVAGSGMSAQVTSTTTDGKTSWRLEITGTQGNPTVGDQNQVAQTLGLLTHAPANVTPGGQAQDAEFSLDGYAMTRNTNSVDDALPGLSLELQAADSSKTINLQVSADSSTAVTAVQSFVDKFNSVMDTLNQGLAYDADTETSGVFFGDGTIINLQQQLIQQAIRPVGTLAAQGGKTSLSELGVSLGQDGKLALDTTKLQSALAADPQAVERLMEATGWADSRGVEYVSNDSGTQDSGMAGYGVNISQLATQATASSAAFAGGQVTSAEILTFNGGPSIVLQAGASLAQATSSLNDFLAANQLRLTASVVGDKLQLTSQDWGAAGDFTVASSLEPGAGGTNWGLAGGAAASFGGLEVRGTINGEAATGHGQYLTGGGTATKGLQLKITATTTGDLGRMYLSKGVAARVQDFTLLITDGKTGSIALNSAAITEQMGRLDDQIASMTSQMGDYIAQLQQEFTYMQQTMAKMQGIGNALTQQMEQLNNANK
ncbi:MAG TPA: flagellar filament capping protein FliD [Armatimonadota bacterium]|jgi:flagellar hook-associated protein 2